MSSWSGVDEVFSVAQAPSFTQAARRLHLSVSQVSREIARFVDIRQGDARETLRNVATSLVPTFMHLAKNALAETAPFPPVNTSKSTVHRWPRSNERGCR
jgi:hypothetical protein